MMCISGTEHSSVLLRQMQLLKKMNRDAPNVPKQAKAIRDGVIIRQISNFNQF